MKYNFDEIINRKDTDSIKWNNLDETYGSDDLLPMWIADMDFKSPQEVIDALKERAEHGVFGYVYKSDAFYNSIINWVKRRYHWEIKKEWILFTPGVVSGLNIGVRELIGENEKVLVQPPVYPPFYRVLDNNNRIANNNPLIHDGEKFVMDFDSLEAQIDDTKLMMLCNPHNPVGRVWTKEELTRLGDICIKNDVIIISDEIHGDFTLNGIKHTPMASISKELERRTITLMAPSKTFNIAGLVTSVAIIPNEDLRNIYKRSIEEMEIDNMNIFGLLGIEVAYNYGEEWLNQLLEYVEGNIDYAINYINKNIPKVKVDKPDGTYLLWLDCRNLNKTADEINEAFLKVGKVILNDGRPYGEQGDGFFRLNIGCPRSVLIDGLNRIEKAIQSLI
ncbi:MAG: pyridoxal phosphate-dependent aminotransferase [Tissierella sp.]|nr:pyridoxal phosphate-dependent aminotransferase [Tissierella sp.]